MEYILPIILVVFFFITLAQLKFFKSEGINYYILAGIFMLKILAGISIFVIYTYYYDDIENVDMYKYFNGGVIVYEETENNFSDYLRVVTGIEAGLPHLHEIYVKTEHWHKKYGYGLYNDNRTMIRFNALLCLVSQGNIYVHIVIMIYLSFIGAYALFKALLLINDANKYALLFAALLIPSSLFWTSGLLKEGLMMFSFGLMFYYYVLLLKKFKISYLLLFILFSALLFLSKIYILPVILPALLFLLISRNMKKRFQLISFFAIILLYGLGIIYSEKIIGYNVLDTVARKQNDFIRHANFLEESGSTINLVQLTPEPISFISNTPKAIINAFFRPFPNEITSVFMLLAFLENLVLIMLLTMMILFFRKFNDKRFRFILFTGIFSFVLFSLVGLSTPNIGAIVRYKIPALPFIFASIFCLTDFDRIVLKYRELMKKES